MDEAGRGRARRRGEGTVGPAKDCRRGSAFLEDHAAREIRPLSRFHGNFHRRSSGPPPLPVESFDSAAGSSRLLRFNAVLGKTIAGRKARLLRAGTDIPECMRLSDDRQTMTLADDHVEGIIWHFVRVA